MTGHVAIAATTPLRYRYAIRTFAKIPAGNQP